MSKTYIIAEAGVNHNGSLDLALNLVEEAAKAGADAVKFQTFITNKNISKVAEKADYQKKTTGEEETQYEMVKKLELSFNDFKFINEHCKKNNITFLSTGFDLESLDFLVNEMDIPYIKIPSGDINNAPLILKAARAKKEILLSTGMSTLEDIHNALAIIYYGYTYPDKTPKNFQEVQYVYQSENIDVLKEIVTIFQCTTEYPTPVGELNLNVLSTLKNEFGTKVGLSDHSEGTLACSLAVALGANVIEKHFTLNKNMEGPDHKASLEPNEFKKMVNEIRFTENALGIRNKVVSYSEEKNITIARKSLVAHQEIQLGNRFTEENLIIKRPGYGISPLLYWDYLGCIVKKQYLCDDLIEEGNNND